MDVGTDYLASLRGRVGYAFDRTLIFATGGVAFTNMSAEATSLIVASLNVDKNYTGWTVGAGAEYAFTDNWIGRIEYRYYDFCDRSIRLRGRRSLRQHGNGWYRLQVLIVTATKKRPG